MTAPLIPSEAVEGLMRKAFVDRTMAAGLFWDALLKANLVVPVTADSGAGQPGGESPKEDDTSDDVPMRLGVDSQGRHVVWLFTSLSALTEYTERELPNRALPALRLFGMLRDTEHDVVLIGPDGLTLRLHPDLVGSLADGQVPEPPEGERTIAKDLPVYVGKPPEVPAALENRFKKLFAHLPGVLEARFMTVSDDTGERLVLGLKLVEETRERLREVAEKLAKEAEGVLDKGRTFDITLINRSLKEAFDKYGKTFYKKVS